MQYLHFCSSFALRFQVRGGIVGLQRGAVCVCRPLVSIVLICAQYGLRGGGVLSAMVLTAAVDMAVWMLTRWCDAVKVGKVSSYASV